ncbi:MAG: hypothetical protein U1A78_39220 [Polyangia bacterium]
MRYLVLCLILIGCNKGDDAKDKEIAALKAQIAAKGAPSLGAVKEQNPALVKPKTALEEAQHESPRPLEFLLDRIDKEEQSPGSLAELFDRADMLDNRSITYAHLEKNAARYIGRPWKFTGRIVEIVEKPGGVMARVALDWYGNHIMMVFGRFETDFVKGNVVDVIGYLAGKYSYESQANWKITIPVLAAHSILKAGTLRKMKAGAHQRRASDEEDTE